MFKIKGMVPYLGFVFSQMAASTLLVGLLELVLARMVGVGAADMWQVYLLHAVMLFPAVALLSPAGFLSDKYPKESVLRIAGVVALVPVALFGLAARLGSLPLAFVAAALVCVVVAFQHPAKFGLIKETTGADRLAQGAGAATIASMLGMIVFGFATAFAFHRLEPGVAVRFADFEEAVIPLVCAAFILDLFALAFSFFLPDVGKRQEEMRFPWKRYFLLRNGRRKLAKAWLNPALRQSIIGLSMFWVMIFQLVFVMQDHFGSGALFNDVFFNIAILLAAVGLVLGCLYAMKMSSSFIETGLIPTGTAGAAVSIFLLPLMPDAARPVFYGLLGFFGGLYMLPMLSMLLYHTKPRSAGHVLAVSNAVERLCVVGFYVVAAVALDLLGLGSRRLFFLLGVVCFAGTVWSLSAMPQTLIRLLMRSVLAFKYRFEVRGLENLPWEGPALLVGNHNSLIDWAMIQMASPRPLRIVIHRESYEKWYINLLLTQMNVIDYDSRKPDEAMQAVREALQSGEAVAIFPENSLSRTGNVNRFRMDWSPAIEGVEGARLVPFYIQGLWGSAYSMATAGYRELIHSEGRSVSVVFGAPMPIDADPVAVKSAVQELSITAWENYIRQLKPLASTWLRTVKRVRNSPAVFAHDGHHFSALSLATVALTFGKMIDELTPGEKNVAIMIPPSAPGIIVNLAAIAKGRAVVNLNYTNTADVLDFCCEKADVKTIFTAKVFVDRLRQRGMDVDKLLGKYKVHYMEDLKERLNKTSLIVNYLRLLLLPAWWLERRDFKRVGLDDVVAIIFSSGSEGTPKGVELTHLNLVADIKQCMSVLQAETSDVMLGLLPLFHAFGFSISTMMCVMEGIPVATCPDPMDVKTIGRLCAEFKVTIVVGTGTFLRMWGTSRHIHPLMFEHIREIFAGAEKIREDVRTLYRSKFKKEIFEGFGCTETTPVAAVNTPDALLDDFQTVQVGNKPGTVGTPLPGTQFRIVDPDTMEELPVGEDGLILIGGPQIMKGYLKDPERTEQALAVIDGHRWYKTGDKGHVDEDGFLTIVDRYSRFAKLGGEMVSLGSIDFKVSESALLDGIDYFSIAVPDAAKGEKVAFMYAGDLDEDQVREKLRAVGLPPLMQPSYVFKVESLPKLGSGKSDFVTAKKLAMARLDAKKI